MAFWQTNTGFQVWIGTKPFSTWFNSAFSTPISTATWNTATTTTQKKKNNTYNPRYPWFDEEDYKKLEKMVADKGIVGKEKTQIMDELYQIYYPQVLNQHKLEERQQEINDSVYKNWELLLNWNKDAQMWTKLTQLSQMAKEKFNIPYNTNDNEVIDAMVKGVPNWSQLLYEYVNGKNQDLLYAAWLKERVKETAWQKAADFGVWVLQSPWKRGYNMIWQWMDKLWKAVADKLEWSDLQKRVQEKAIEAFWEDEVRAFAEQRQKELEEWTAFNGREQTDIRTPLLWEERANSWWTKAWEVVGDIGTAIAMSAPLSSALAPAMATQWVWNAALLWAIEWGIDTLATQYGSQWNLNVTPTQAILWIWGGALGGVITNKLANLPKDKVDDVVVQAKNQLREDVKPYIEKSIKPTVKGKPNQTQYDKFIDDTLDSISDMVNNKQYLQYTDDAWEKVVWELPKNMRETAEAIGNYKKFIYDKYNTIAKEAWDAGARVNLNKVYQQLDDLSKDISQNIANPWTQNIIDTFKKSLIDYSDDAGTIAIEDAQKLTQDFNKQLTAFFKNPNMNDVSKNAIIANMNKWVKDAINDSLDDVLDAWIKNWSKASQDYVKLKKLYGSLTNIEDEVSKRALVEARKNMKWLSDTILDSFAWWEITDAILTLDPVKAAKSWVMKWISSWYKYLNSPNRNIMKLFETVENWSNPSLWSKFWTPTWDGLVNIAREGAIYWWYPAWIAVWTTVYENEKTE